MLYGLNETLQMCTVKLKVDLVTNLRKSKSSENGLKSGLEYYDSGYGYAKPPPSAPG